MPPPPPPPPPPPGMGGPPPPPPPPGANNLPARPNPTRNTGALLTDITRGTRLKKTVTNDRSAPILERPKDGSAPPSGAPPIPGMLKPPSRESGNSNDQRARSNSDNSVGLGTIAEAPPQLGGLFADGMPKLKKRSGGIDTGASTSSPSGPPLPPQPPALAPRPIPTQGRRTTLDSLPARPPVRTNADSRSTSSNLPPRAPPPLPGSRPSAPAITSRKPSGFAPPVPSAPPPPPSAAPLPPSAPPLPPTLPPVPVNSNSSSTPLSSLRSPPARSTPPPPPSTPPALAFQNEPNSNSLAKHAMLNSIVSGNSSPTSPAFAPPPPPLVPAPAIPTPPTSRPTSHNIPPSILSPPPSRPASNSTVSSMLSPQASQTPLRNALDPSSYTLSNGSNRPDTNPTGSRSPSYGLGSSGVVRVVDNRWRFQDDSQLPKPRDFQGVQKRYRAGRGSSVPLDLSQFV